MRNRGWHSREGEGVFLFKTMFYVLVLWRERSKHWDFNPPPGERGGGESRIFLSRGECLPWLGLVITE